MRPAVALLITMIFIVAILAMIGSYFSFTNRAFDRLHSIEDMLQANILLNDLKGGLLNDLADFAHDSTKSLCEMSDDKTKCKSETLSSILNSFYGLPLTFSAGQKEVALSCAPAQTKIDINSLNSAIDENRSILLRERVDRFLHENYKLYATWQLFELLDALFDKNDEKYGYLKNDERLLSTAIPKGAIRSNRDLQKIAHDYEVLTSDEAIHDIPFDVIFDYESKRSHIDFNHMNKTSCQIAFGSTSPVCELLGKNATINEVKALASDADEIIKTLKIGFGYNPVLECRASLRRGNRSNKYGFIFDIDQKRLDRFTIE